MSFIIKLKKQKLDFKERKNVPKVVGKKQTHEYCKEQLLKKIKNNPKLTLQPEWSKSKEINPKILKYIKSNPKWRISLQTHKYLNVEQVYILFIDIEFFSD